MTRYSDLIAHFQKLIEKEGDRPFARNDGPWTCGFFLQQVTSENRKLNKAVHRKNRHIERLKGEIKDLKREAESQEKSDPVFLEGFEAFRAGKGVMHNPYSESNAFSRWKNGWWEAHSLTV